MKRCGCYVRVSTFGQRDNYSVEVQRKRAITFCKANGYELVLYDEQASASTLLRDEFTRLLTDVQQERIQAVWCIEFTRLTRDEADAIEIRKIFVKYKIRLFINGVDTDLTSPESVLMFNINSAVASYERLRFMERSIRGKQEWRDKGLLKFSTVFGYDNTFLPDGTKQVIVNTEEAKCLRYMFQLYADGLSLRTICRRLTEEGFKGKKGGEWAPANICRYFQKLEYAGLTTNSKGETIESKIYPAIIEMDLWQRVQNAKRLKLGGPVQNLKRGKFQLSNILKCGKCGSGYYYNYNTYKSSEGPKKREYYAHNIKTAKSYKCRNRPKSVSIEFLQDLVGGLYLNTFNDYYDIEHYIKLARTDLLQQGIDVKESVDRINSQLAEEENKRKRLIDAVVDGILDKTEAIQKSNTINDEISKLRKNLEEKVNQVKLKEDNLRDIINAFAYSDSDQFFDLTDCQKRKLYMERITKLTITDNIIEAEFLTGRAYIIDMKELPEWLKGEMEILRTYREAQPMRNEKGVLP
jgi:DNA invertase Pin-like site-specific DNA recombinase